MRKRPLGERDRERCRRGEHAADARITCGDMAGMSMGSSIGLKTKEPPRRSWSCYFIRCQSLAHRTRTFFAAALGLDSGFFALACVPGKHPETGFRLGFLFFHFATGAFFEIARPTRPIWSHRRLPTAERTPRPDRDPLLPQATRCSADKHPNRSRLKKAKNTISLPTRQHARGHR